MRFFIVDNRHFLPGDYRLITALQVLNETATLSRATLWTHFGMAIVGENMYADVLPLQDMEHLSLFAFNKAFDDLGKIIRNNNATFGLNLAEKKPNMLKNIAFALQSAMKQFKGLKGKKKRELLIILIAAKWRGNVEREVEEFLLFSRGVVGSQIHVIEAWDVNVLRNFAVTDNIQVHSLPIKSLYTGIQAVCKTGMRCSELILNFRNGNIDITTKIDDLCFDFSISRRDPDIPQKLTVISYAYSTDLCQSRVNGRCFLLSSTKTDALNIYRWEALHKLLQTNGTVLLAKELITFFTYILIPCNNLLILMQPIACADLTLPSTTTTASEHFLKDFDNIAKNCCFGARYGFGPNSKIICHLKQKWSKQVTYCPTEWPDSKQSKHSASTKKRVSLNPTRVQKISSLAHPALAMYSNK